MPESKGKILFRADGSNATGLGHIYRALALASAFSQENECLFITRRGNGEEIIRDNFPMTLIPELASGEEADWLEERYPPADWKLVADGYHFIAQYQEAVKTKGYYMIYVDDLISGHYFADLIINHSPAARANQYNANPSTRFALGADYALLRETFLTADGEIERSGGRTIALACFGGSDPAGLLIKSCTALERINSVAEIHAVVGSAFSAAQIERLGKLSHKVTIHRNLDEQALARLMRRCDFAVSSASTVLYELCALKVPVIAGYYVSNQEGLYEGFLKTGAICGAGNISSFESAEFETAIKSFLQEKNWEKYSKAQAKLFDGKTRKRLALLAHRITYRTPVMDDVMLVYSWANEPLTRANSYSSEPIDLETHKNWFARKLTDATTLICIAEFDGQPAGMIRYELRESHAVVGILLDASFRGRALSPLLLKDTARIYFESHNLPVHASIKKTNLASIRAFEKAGYKLTEERTVQGTASYIYKLEQEDV